MTDAPPDSLVAEAQAAEEAEDVTKKKGPRAVAEVEQQMQEQWTSLDEVYAEVKDALAVQREHIKYIDSKANFGLTASTLLTAGVTGLGRALAEAGQDVTASETLFGMDIRIDQMVDWVSVLSLSIYAATAFCAYKAYSSGPFQASPHPSVLTDNYIRKEPRITKATITAERANNFVFNEEVIKRKARWTSATMLLLVVEAVLLIVIAVLQASWL